MNVIILGPPGSGDLLRNEITLQSEIGLLAKKYINQGKYVPDDIMNTIVDSKITKIKDNFILDGYPRTIGQVKFLETVLQKNNFCKTTYNKIFLPPKVDSLCNKDKTPLIQRTDDSTQEKIIYRLNEYNESTQPLVAYFKNQGILQVLDANQENEMIHQQLKRIINSMRELAKLIKVGTTGKMLDLKARQIIKKHGATPSFLNYHGFPAAICVSVNEQLIHGIPNDVPFKLNDLVKVDAGAAINGYHSDAAFTMCVGQPTKEQEKIINITKEALKKAIKMIKPGVRIGDISAVIQTYVESQGFYLPISYTGHGIGKSLHEDPAIPNVGIINTGVKLHAGMTICVEPMVTTSSSKIRVLDDQ
ncbi:methionine aminopeptidase [Lasius niger]|uniref:Methionine aminopeptidase n=1 Tax=Lasius niger TaxID=67767 RepID=A0A0J7KQK2_LASNI|nr:methionine aminopeptidase [Lasius niger]